MIPSPVPFENKNEDDVQSASLPRRGLRFNCRIEINPDEKILSLSLLFFSFSLCVPRDAQNEESRETRP